MYSRSLIAFNSHLFTATIAISIHLADHITLLQYVFCLLHTTIWYHSSITTSTLKRKKRKIQCTTEQSTVQVTIQSQKKQESKKNEAATKFISQKRLFVFEWGFSNVYGQCTAFTWLSTMVVKMTYASFCFFFFFF